MKTLFSVLLFSFLFSNLNTTNAQWIPVQGMDGESVSDIECQDSLIFIAASNGIKVKPVTGGEWTSVITAYTSTLVNSGSYLYADAGWPRWYRSNDYWQTWDTLANTHIELLTAIGSTLFSIQYDWGLNASEVFRSDDNGDSWYIVSQFPSMDAPARLFSHDSILMTSNFWSRYFYSADMGLTWDSLYSQGLPPNTWGYNVYHYASDFWTTCSNGTYKYNMPLHQWEFSTPVVFYEFTEYLGNLCGGGDGFYRYDTIGQFWTELSTGLDGYGYCLSVRDTLLFAGSISGPFFTDPSMNWQSLCEGLHGTTIWSVSVEGDEVFASTSQGLYRSSDAGSTFTKIQFDSAVWLHKVLIRDNIYYGNYGGLWVSKDHGATWVQEKQGLPPGSSINDFDVGSDYIFASVFGDVYRSALDPIYWTNLSIPGPTDRVDLAVHDSTVLMGRNYSNKSAICLSHDNLGTFDTIDIEVMQEYGYLTYKNNYFQIFDYFMIYFSDDEGNTWDSVSMSFDPYINPSGFMVKDGTFFLTGFYSEGRGFVFESFDKGVTWNDISDNLSGNTCAFVDVNASDDRIILSTQYLGLWYRDDLITSSDNYSSKEDMLKVYPSPAHDHINVKADFEGSGQISIFDIYGNERYTKKVNNGTGNINDCIPLKGFSEGIYILKLETDNSCMVKKFLKD